MSAATERRERLSWALWQTLRRNSSREELDTIVAELEFAQRVQERQALALERIADELVRLCVAIERRWEPRR